MSGAFGGGGGGGGGATLGKNMEKGHTVNIYLRSDGHYYIILGASFEPTLTWRLFDKHSTHP